MHAVFLFLRIIQLVAWVTFNLCFKVIQYLVWQVTGVSATLRQGEKNPSSPTSAQVLKVRGGFKFCDYLMPASIWDFLLTHERFETPEYVLQDHITLYSISKNEAVFVETEPGRKVWDARTNPSFFMAAQYFSAVNVIRMPLGSLHYLADKLGNPKGELILLSNCARCGSTLLAQMFEATDRIISFGEPNCLNFLSKVSDTNSNNGLTKNKDLERLAISTIRVLCKPTSGGHELAYAIKPTSPAMAGIPFIKRLFPNAKLFYLYRDPLKVAQSLCRLSCSLYGAKLIYFFGCGSAARLSACMTAVGYPASLYRFCVKEQLALGVFNWCLLLREYKKFREDGLDIVALRYEDLVGNTVDAMRKIFRFCNLPEDLAEKSAEALKWDSQKDTPLSTNVLKRFPLVKYEGESKAECDRITEHFGFPTVEHEYIADFTITLPDSK